MALSIKGSPQKIKSVGSLDVVAKDSVAASAMRQAAVRSKEKDGDAKRRGGRGAGKA